MQFTRKTLSNRFRQSYSYRHPTEWSTGMKAIQWVLIHLLMNDYEVYSPGQKLMRSLVLVLHNARRSCGEKSKEPAPEYLRLIMNSRHRIERLIRSVSYVQCNE